MTPRELHLLAVMLELVLGAERSLTEAELIELMLSFGGRFRDAVNEETIQRFLHTPIVDLLVAED